MLLMGRIRQSNQSPSSKGGVRGGPFSATLVACFVIVAIIALAFSNRQMLRRMFVIFGATVAQMALVVVVVWVVYQTYAWWAYLLWFLLVLFLSTCWCLYPLQAMWKKMLWPVSGATLVGNINTLKTFI